MKAFARVLSALLAALIMCVPLSGCAGSDTGVLGLYTLAQVRDGGEVYSAGEAYAQPCTLELKRNKAVLTLDGNRIYGKWFVEDGVFDLVTDGGVSHGTLNDGVCTFDYLDDGLVHVFLREGAALPDDVPGGNPGAEEGALARQWNGDWYGWWSLSNASGDWAALDGQIYDCFARISIDDTGVGTLRLWDEQLSAADPIGVADISVTPGADGSMGTARTLGGSAGTALETIILSSSVLYELIGPACAKLSLYLSHSYSNRLEDITPEPEPDETGCPKSEVERLIERINSIQSELPAHRAVYYEDEKAFSDAAEEHYAALYRALPAERRKR